MKKFTAEYLQDLLLSPKGKAVITNFVSQHINVGKQSGCDIDIVIDGIKLNISSYAIEDLKVNPEGIKLENLQISGLSIDNLPVNKKRLIEEALERGELE